MGYLRRLVEGVIPLPAVLLLLPARAAGLDPERSRSFCWYANGEEREGDMAAVEEEEEVRRG
jgi:hypothetical protein